MKIGKVREGLSSQWWKKAVVYQVYPRSFQDSNNDGIGDINGITSRLEYLKKLGVDVVWLNPIYVSPNIDGGYDISDYQNVNPDFGTMTDLDNLFNKAHELNLKIMMDLVVNHTSDEHAWFKESRASRNNAKRDFYIWRDPVDGHEPNNWGSYFDGPAWQWDEQTQQYYLHLFAAKQPDLNWSNPQVRDAVYQMMNFWVDKGVDGFRMDVINLISKPDGLPDAPQAKNDKFGDVEAVVANGPHVHEYIQELHDKVLKGHNVITVGETPGAQPKDAVKYAGENTGEFNMTFQFEHMELDDNDDPSLGKWSDKKTSLADLRTSLSKWQTGLHGQAWNSLYWNNHDRPRMVSRFGNDSKQYRVLSAKMLATLLHFLQGTPYIFQGEEIGMTNMPFEKLEDYRDIESLNAYHYLVEKNKRVSHATMMSYLYNTSRDNARTPMQWSNEINGGFSSHQPWIVANPNYQSINVKDAIAKDNSLFYYYQRLIKLRHELPIITDGDYKLVSNNDRDNEVYAYTRNDAKTSLLVICNFTDQIVQRDYHITADAQLVISNYDNDLKNELRPYEAKVYQIK
ncbi:oligo-1,6-glucosidase [Paucilactobacillus hokkaidonensis JCM 18461]|uniref:Oligo-1,6-glucosidase n=2 Tax=Paucilactobacillus hokkaidonensis TaxID=1193095 RepID=A0A0A1H137_9LACO|nr:alpha-glucosidase [Paucilactobacillus hokkaidonensis]KRO11206.1 hypothetical protein IV59_GL000959 [Paucilactobacillus hokkaidonensis]BAP86431.1 oligo-1,6-glucosidase [Paucilactobacillus hokkaidonensis JCM 18461]